MPSPRPAVFALVLAALSACGGPDVEQLRKDAQAALDAGDTAKALQLVDTAIPAAGSDAAEVWRLEQIRLDAQARAGQGGDVVASLDRLAKTYDKQLTAALYRSLADKLVAAKDTKGATTLLEAGDKKFPADHDSFVKAIQELSAGGAMDPAEVERLKALGYL